MHKLYSKYMADGISKTIKTPLYKNSLYKNTLKKEKSFMDFIVGAIIGFCMAAVLFSGNANAAEMGTVVAVSNTVGGDIESIHKCVSVSDSAVSKACPLVVQKRQVYIVSYNGVNYTIESGMKLKVGDKVKLRINVTLD